MNISETNAQLETVKEHLTDGATAVSEAEAQRADIDGRVGHGLATLNTLKATLGSLHADVYQLCQRPDEILQPYQAAQGTLAATAEGSNNQRLTKAQAYTNAIVAVIGQPGDSRMRLALERMRTGSDTVQRALGMLAAGLEDLEEGSAHAFLDLVRIGGSQSAAQHGTRETIAAAGATQDAINEIESYQASITGSTT